MQIPPSEFSSTAEGPSVTRRALLAGGAALYASSLLGCENSDQHEQLSLKEVLTPVDRKASTEEIDLPLHTIDRPYLAFVFKQLQSERYDTKDQVNAVRDARRVVRLWGENQYFDFGTSLQLDESGIYLTASHIGVYSTSLALGQYQLAVQEPSTGELSRVKAVIKHPRADMALLFAPTGTPRNVTSGLSLSTAPITARQRLWMIGYAPLKDGSLDAVELPGVTKQGVDVSAVRSHDKWFPKHVWEKQSQIAVSGMIPSGGTSGSPIINDKGQVVAVESGAYPTVQRQKDYKGAVVTPVAYAADFEDLKAYYY